MRVWTLEKTIEVQFDTGADSFRIEAYGAENSSNKFRIRLFQYGLFRLHPTFDDYPEGGADHSFQTASFLCDGEELECGSANEALQIAVQGLKMQGFG
jgi:hypothetical protein